MITSLTLFTVIRQLNYWVIKKNQIQKIITVAKESQNTKFWELVFAEICTCMSYIQQYSHKYMNINHIERLVYTMDVAVYLMKWVNIFLQHKPDSKKK